jgi:hypothetical protein
MGTKAEKPDKTHWNLRELEITAPASKRDVCKSIPPSETLAITKASFSAFTLSHLFQPQMNKIFADDLRRNSCQAIWSPAYPAIETPTIVPQ